MSALARSTGVLLHPSALPGSPICGSFGEPSRRWIHLLTDNNIGVWQILPLAPPDGTGSPYNSPSCFALNPWFLDADDLRREGFITDEDFQTRGFGSFGNDPRKFYVTEQYNQYGAPRIFGINGKKIF